MKLQLIKAAALGTTLIAAATYSTFSHAAPVSASTAGYGPISLLQTVSDVGVRVDVGPGGVGVRVGDRGHRGRYYGWGGGFRYYDGHYHGNCGWLREKARETGSRVWWNRYQRCRNG